MHKPRPVARVGVVVDREEIAEIVERDLLRIAEPSGKHIEARAVGLTAKHRAAGRIVGHVCLALAVLVFDLVAPVADREIEPAVGAKHEPVHVVTTECHAGAVARREHGPLGRRGVDATVAIEIAQPVEARDARQEHVSAAGENPGGGPLDEPVEAIRKDGRRIGHAVAVRVDEQPHAIIMGFPLACLVAEQPTVIRQPVLDRLRCEIGVDPFARMAPVVAHTAVLPKRLADKDPSLFIDGEGDGIRHIGLGGEEFHGHASGHAKSRARLGRLIRAGRNDGRLG